MASCWTVGSCWAAEVPWSDSSEGQGGLWAPPPCCDKSSETMLFLCQVSFVRVLWNIGGFYVWGFLVSGAGILLGWCPFKTCPLLGKLFVVLPFFSGCLVDFVVVALSLSLSLSLSQALGKPKPLGVWVSPCVLCFLDKHYEFDPFSVLRKFTCPAPVFFFFFPLRRRRSLVCWSVRWRSVAFLFGCFVFRLVVGGCWFGSVGPLFALHARWVGWL